MNDNPNELLLDYDITPPIEYIDEDDKDFTVIWVCNVLAADHGSAEDLAKEWMMQDPDPTMVLDGIVPVVAENLIT